MNNTQKIILLSAISLSGISKAQQSQFFADKEQYRFNLAENLYQNKSTQHLKTSFLDNIFTIKI